MTTFLLPADYYPEAALVAARERFEDQAEVTFRACGAEVEVTITARDGGGAIEREVLNAALRWAAAHAAGLA